MSLPEDLRQSVPVAGQFNQSNAGVLAGPEDPTSAGVSTTIGSLYLNTSTGQVFKKVGTGNTDWEEIGDGILGIGVENQGVTVPNGPFINLNFTGPGVVASDAGGQEATITIAGDPGDRRYFTTVVGNSLEGDLAPEVDFLDPGDGSGIQDAINNLPAQGGTILIRKGIYSLTSTITVGISSVKIMGEGIGNTFIQNPDGGSVKHFDITANVDDVEFSDMTIHDRNGAGGNTPMGIEAINRIINRLKIHDIHFTQSGNAQQVIHLNGRGANWSIHDCIFEGVGDTIGAIRIEDFINPPEQISISNNWFLDQNTGAISVETADEVLISNNIVSLSPGAGNYDAVRTVGCNQVNVSDNVFEGVQSRGIVMNTTTTWAVTGNVFGAGSADSCIRVLGGSDGLISGNIVNGGTTAAIDFLSTVSDRTTISGNSLSGTNGILISNVSSNIEISNNTLESCTTGVSITAAATSVRISNNRFIAVTTPVSDGGVRTVIRGNSFQETFVQTTDATPTTLFSFTLNDDTVYTFKAIVAARDTAGVERAGYERTVRAHRQGGGGATVGTVQDSFTDETNAGLDCTWTVSGNAIILQVTGLAATTIDWTSLVEFRAT